MRLTALTASTLLPAMGMLCLGSEHETIPVSFTRSVANVEYLSDLLGPEPPRRVSGLPALEGTSWFGEIPRNLPEADALSRSDLYVPFVAEYRDGIAVRAWHDSDLDGDLSDEAPVGLRPHPGSASMRSFLAEIAWSSRLKEREKLVAWTVRVLLHPLSEPSAPPRYRLQMVFAMTGTVTLAGKPHRAFLFDGSADGFYTRNLLDGLFVDVNDDGHVEVEQFSPEFAPLTVPFQMEGISYEVASVDPDGSSLSLRALGPVETAPAPVKGAAVPDVVFTDTQGRQLRLADFRGRHVVVYFWASWCGNCAAQAEGMKRLQDAFHPRGLQIIGVSYDTQRDAMEAFRDLHGHTWPTTYSGHMFWEDPIGRAFRARGAGLAFLVGPTGILEEVYTDPAAIASRLQTVLR